MATTKTFTEEQQKLYDAFILKCVTKNASIPHSARMGVERKYTVQELIQLDPNTLKAIGKQIETAANRHGGSRFEKESRFQVPAGSGIFGEEWLDFIELVIVRKESAQAAQEQADRIKELEAFIHKSKDTKELRAEAEEELKRLKGETTPASVTAS
jgi:hypothetical protein